MSRHEWPGLESMTRGFGETFHRTTIVTMCDVMAGRAGHPVVRPIVHVTGRDAHHIYTAAGELMSNRRAAQVLAERADAMLRERDCV